MAESHNQARFSQQVTSYKTCSIFYNLLFQHQIAPHVCCLCIIIIIIITRMIFIVLSSWQSHCESSPGSFNECRLSAKVAANPQTKPTDLDCEFAERQLPSTSTIAILLLLSPRADTHFTVPRRVEGWVNLGTAVGLRVCSPCPRLYIAVAVVINTTACSEIRTWVLSHRSQACYRFKPGVKERGSYRCSEWWIRRGRSEGIGESYALHVMRAIATDGVALSVCLCVCLLVTFVSSSKNDRDAEVRLLWAQGTINIIITRRSNFGEFFRPTEKHCESLTTCYPRRLYSRRRGLIDWLIDVQLFQTPAWTQFFGRSWCRS